jgi:hypothetical protein
MDAQPHPRQPSLSVEVPTGWLDKRRPRAKDELLVREEYDSDSDPDQPFYHTLEELYTRQYGPLRVQFGLTAASTATVTSGVVDMDTLDVPSGKDKEKLPRSMTTLVPHSDRLPRLVGPPAPKFRPKPLATTRTASVSASLTSSSLPTAPTKIAVSVSSSHTSTALKPAALTRAELKWAWDHSSRGDVGYELSHLDKLQVCAASITFLSLRISLFGVHTRLLPFAL